MKKKIILTICIILAIFLLFVAVGFVGLGVMYHKNLSFTKGRYLLSDTGVNMIITDRGEPIKMTNIKSKEGLFAGLTNGDEILVINGLIEETYPANTDVYAVYKTGDGEFKDLPSETVDALTKLNWIKEKGSAEEKNFTAREVLSYSILEGTTAPQVTVIKSVADLNDYLGKITGEKSQYQEKYTEEYFKDRVLAVVTVQESTNNVRHRIESIELLEDGNLNIKISRYQNHISSTPAVEDSITGDTVVTYHGFFIEPDSKLSSQLKNAENIVPNISFSKGEGMYFEVMDFVDTKISLIVPDGWVAERSKTSSYNGTEYDGLFLGIRIYPKEYKDNFIEVVYDNSFGVCGTGLTSAKVQIGGYTCTMGTYDGNEMWSFINYDLEHIAINHGADSWWNEYGDEAMQILATVEYN